MTRPTCPRNLALQLITACLPLAVAPSLAAGANSLTNSLTGFTGDSTQAAAQAAVAAAGLNFSRTVGNVEDPPGSGEFIDPTVQFDATGARFGNLFTGDGGRNFIRTIEADYSSVSFVAEVTWVSSDMFSQAAYFGLGSAEPGAFRIADWGTEFSAVQLFLEMNPAAPEIVAFTNRNGVTQFGESTAVPPLQDLGAGTHRLRLSYDWFSKTAVFSIDANYAGGAFAADASTPPVRVIDLYGPDGWPAEPARPYFGGDDGVMFRDLQVTVSTQPMLLGDFNDDDAITSADWAILRNNQLADLSGMTFQQAYLLGDVTADLANNHADFTAFKQLFDAANGVGSFAAMVASTPEPASMVLVLSACLAARPLARCAARRRKS